MITPGALEALLYIYGEPLTLKKAAQMLGASAEELRSAVDALRQVLASDERGLLLAEHEGTVQLTTKPGFGGLLQTILKAELNESLTPAALETLSIITYAGPIARAEIDYIRGVNSSFTIRALLLRGLIERESDTERANAYRYRPSVALLHHLGVGSTSELPEFDRFRTLVASLKSAPTAAPSPTAPTSE